MKQIIRLRLHILYIYIYEPSQFWVDFWCHICPLSECNVVQWESVHFGNFTCLWTLTSVICDVFYLRAFASSIIHMQFHATMRNSAQFRSIPLNSAQFRANPRNFAQRNSDRSPSFLMTKSNTFREYYFSKLYSGSQ